MHEHIECYNTAIKIKTNILVIKKKKNNIIQVLELNSYVFFSLSIRSINEVTKTYP